MKKQFGRTLLTVMSLAVATAMLSSIPAQAQGTGSSVVTHGFVSNFGIFDGSTGELTFVSIESTAKGNLFSYQMIGPTSGSGAGSIPASSINVSGMVSKGNVTLALNVNTCDLDPSFTTSGSCGTFSITLVQIPASVGGSTTTSGTTQIVTPGLGTTIINGRTQTFSALLSGTMLGYVLPNGPFAPLEALNEATVTHTK